MTDEGLEQIVSVLREHDLAVVVFGDSLDGGLPLLFDSRQEAVWTKPAIAGVDSYRRQLTLFDRLRRSNLKVAVGVKSGRSMDGPALLGVPTVYMEHPIAWKWGMECGHVPARALPRARIKIDGYVTNHRNPSDSDVSAVLAQLSGDSQLAVRILATTGARVSEVCNLRGSDLDVQQGLLRLCGKTGARWFPLPADLLTDLKPRAGDEGTLLNLGKRAPQRFVRDRMKAACDRAKVQRFTPHGLRRFVVDRVVRMGVDISAAADLLGHSPQVMLKAYRQVSDNDRRHAVAVARLGYLPAGDVIAGPRGHRKRAQRLKMELDPPPRCYVE